MCCTIRLAFSDSGIVVNYVIVLFSVNGEQQIEFEAVQGVTQILSSPFERDLVQLARDHAGNISTSFIQSE